MSTLQHWNHRMFQDGRDFKAHPFPTPTCHGLGHISLDQVAPSPIQSNPEHFQKQKCAINIEISQIYS